MCPIGKNQDKLTLDTVIRVLELFRCHFCCYGWGGNTKRHSGIIFCEWPGTFVLPMQ